jgi:pimeloyl-ACP methyl ester carboxylesterase
MMEKPLPDARSVSVSGRQMRYIVSGEGHPAVVFIAGAGMGLESWRAVFSEALAISTAFAYDRLDIGASDPAAEPQSGALIVDAMRRLLATSGLAPPYLLVGHSLGGVFANLYARLAPEDVGGVIFVDAAHPDQRQEDQRAYQRLLLRAVTVLFGLFDRIRGAKLASEMESLDATRRQIEDAGPFPDIPVVVITGGRRPPSWLIAEPANRDHLDRQRQLVELSPRGRHLIAERSGHFPQISEPDLVIGAIRDLILEIGRTGPGEVGRGGSEGVH